MSHAEVMSGEILSPLKPSVVSLLKQGVMEAGLPKRGTSKGQAGPCIVRRYFYIHLFTLDPVTFSSYNHPFSFASFYEGPDAALYGFIGFIGRYLVRHCRKSY